MSRYWKANNHDWGPGKIHEIDDRRDGRLMCGKEIKFTPGRELPGSYQDDVVTCKMCQQKAESRKKNDDWKIKQQEIELRRERERKEWWEWYNKYLESDQWTALRAKVFHRCQGRCEGCYVKGARQVHHLTYDHVGNEMLFELVGLCDDCHARAHGGASERLNRLFDGMFNRALWEATKAQGEVK